MDGFSVYIICNAQLLREQKLLFAKNSVLHRKHENKNYCLVSSFKWGKRERKYHCSDENECVLRRRVSDYWQTLDVYAMLYRFISFALVGIPHQSVFCYSCRIYAIRQSILVLPLWMLNTQKRTHSTLREHVNAVLVSFVFILCLLNSIRVSFCQCFREPCSQRTIVIVTLHFHLYCWCFDLICLLPVTIYHSYGTVRLLKSID